MHLLVKYESILVRIPVYIHNSPESVVKLSWFVKERSGQTDRVMRRDDIGFGDRSSAGQTAREAERLSRAPTCHMNEKYSALKNRWSCTGTSTHPFQTAPTMKAYTLCGSEMVGEKNKTDINNFTSWCCRQEK